MSVTERSIIIGCERFQEVKTRQEDFDDHKEVEFDLKVDESYRIDITGPLDNFLDMDVTVIYQEHVVSCAEYIKKQYER